MNFEFYTCYDDHVLKIDKTFREKIISIYDVPNGKFLYLEIGGAG